MNMKKIHHINGMEVSEDELEDYCCNHCGINIKDYEWGFREDAYGHYYCDSEEECRDALVMDLDHVGYECEEEEE
jgi:hypothetical protein